MSKISNFIAQLKSLIEIKIQANWLINSDLTNNSNWQPVQPNEKEYITWSSGGEVKYLKQEIIIPKTINDYPIDGLSLRLALTWWAQDAKIFVNNNLVQEGDLFDSSARILLTNQAIPGETILVILRLVSPFHDIGALMASRLIYEKPIFLSVIPNFSPVIPANAGIQKQNDIILKDNLLIDPGFFADELAILTKYLENFEPEKLEILAQYTDNFNWNLVHSQEAFHQELLQLREKIKPLGSKIKERSFNLLGHAHLDMAWLWEVEETWEVAQRTFTSVLNLQQDYPNLTFGHTTSALYQWIENNRPDLFKKIQDAILNNHWELLGGMWVEPDVNLVSGESIIRQLLYGQLYLKEKFGICAKIAWLPDSFGFCWQLPQILKLCQIDYFVTGKLHWNDTTKFPDDFFIWESPDGSQILTLMSPPNVAGVMDTNPITMTNYAINWEKNTGLKEIFWLPGVGDHGGGPTRDMLEVAKRWQNSPFFPNIRFTTAWEYLEKITPSINKETATPRSDLNTNLCELRAFARNNHHLTQQHKEKLPIWKDELYLEFHRGCYTTHADQKYFNRLCERLLYEGELFSSIAILLQEKGGYRTTPFPIIQYSTSKLNRQVVKETIFSAWKRVLFNQFHDILPGTSIREVFIQANQDWREAEAIARDLRQTALEEISASFPLPFPPYPEAKPLLVFNSLNWKRSEVVSLDEWGYQIFTDKGEGVVSQLTEDGELLFFAEDIPALGYRVFWVREDGFSQRREGAKDCGKMLFILENDYLKVIIDSETGNIAQIFDKINQREVLSDQGNQLQMFQDRGQYWDAWNIDPNYEDDLLDAPKLKCIEWRDRGFLQQSVRVIREFNQSEFCQDYILQVNSPILKIKTTVNWQESHLLVKAAFPLTVTSDQAVYDIPCSAIARSTAPNSSKWEVPALYWADLSDNNYGVSLLNDCKYGYDAKPSQLRLTLLRSSTWPDPSADQGKHQFTYSIYPHRGNWIAAKTVNKGYELNFPLIVHFPKNKANFSREAKDSFSFFEIKPDHLILMSFKLAENDQGWILRCYEAYGKNDMISIENDLGIEIDHCVDCLEEKIITDLSVTPWRIMNFRLS